MYNQQKRENKLQKKQIAQDTDTTKTDTKENFEIDEAIKNTNSVWKCI